MTRTLDELQKLFCDAFELKERKVALYEKASAACADPVGVETFRMLVAAEKEHAESIHRIYEDLKKGKPMPAVCVLDDEKTAGIMEVFRRVAREQKTLEKACATEIGAIETGMELEQAAITFFEGEAKKADDPAGREFLSRLATDEREHFRVLADLKFYYTDPESWFMEKGKAGLDGAGGSA